MSVLLSIDPSINNLGMAIWEVEKKRLIHYKLLHPMREMRKNEFEKSISMMRQLREYVEKYYINIMIVEVPEYWAVGGFEARETGSMTKLMFVCGMICSLVEMEIINVLSMVTPRDWKGQLPKNVVKNRLRESYLENVDLLTLNDNVVDAIGIGHFYLYGGV